MLSRREFIKLGAVVGASLFIPLKWLRDAPPAYAFSQSNQLRKFIQPLRGVGAPIPVAVPDDPESNPGWWQKEVTHYTIDIGQFQDQLHPDLANPTRLWGFGQGYVPGNRPATASWTKHLGGIIAAKRGEPVQITFRNHLPSDHILPVDTTIMGAELSRSRADIHLHGGLVPWTSDGGPYAWWDTDGTHGASFMNNQVLRPGQTVPLNEAEYYYPNDQGSRLAWYHDHTFGNTRINAYAGIASAYVIYDDYELSLVQYNSLPGPLDPRTVYLVFQDKIFVSDATEKDDPSWFGEVRDSAIGDLWYAHTYETSRWDVDPNNPTATQPQPSVIPEFFGDTILVNGTVAPYLEVEQRQYRFCTLNACNARFLKPRLVYAQNSASTEPNLAAPGPVFIQIGTEGGFLPAPVMVNNGPTGLQLLTAPAERTDLIVDFRDVPAGSTLILYNDAGAPFPMGDDVNDYFPGNANNLNSGAVGFTPDTRALLQIRVKARSGAADPVITLPPSLTPTDPFIVKQAPGYPTPPPAGITTRYLTLNEVFDDRGRLIQNLGTNEPINPGIFGRAYDDDPTEVIQAGATEVWEILNLTGDVHPMHFHLVNVQVLSRQDFDADHYAGGLPTYTDYPEAPDDNELGWKETVRMYPNQVTRVLMQFRLAAVPFTVPESPRTGGHEFVWHCHILEHEEHDMMRPLIVKENKTYLPLVGG